MLADRLKRLEQAGILSRAQDPKHKQKVIYSLTEQGIELFPLLARASAWGVKYLPVTDELGARARVLAEGGARLEMDFMAELREEHLGIRRKRKKRSVRELMQEAYDDA